jgi:radical SAM superfamily enzyme YgiQ (UPF0313 family)
VSDLVLLVNPNRLQPPVAPLALDYLADYLAAQGIPVRLLDLCFEPDPEQAIRQVLADLAPVLVGVTIRNTDDCYLASGDDFLPGFAHIVSLLRRHTSAPIVLGGSGFSIAPAPILLALGADYGVAGDGEVPLAMLASALASGATPSGIPGLVWRKDGTVIANPSWSGSPASLPRRTRSWLGNQRYFAEGGQAGIETKRGCDRGCIYCADPLGKGRVLRLRAPAQVADEFAALLSQGIDQFHLCDSEFNVPPDHALAVCEEMIGHGLGRRAHWYTYASPGAFAAELAQAMRRAGCVGVNFGADSGDDQMLRALGRDFQVADLRDTARACREAGLVFMFDLLLGGPGETRESIARTIATMKAISPDRVGVSLGLRIYPGTALSRYVRGQGPLANNPHLRGAVAGNPDFTAPVFYLSRELGEEAERYVAELVGGDQRFFFPTADAGAESYNYNNNQRLVDAIKRGYRGAYWDILRRLAEGPL